MSHTSLLCNPTLDQVVKVAAEMLDGVQGYVKTRKVISLTADDLRQVSEIPQGLVQRHGGQPEKSHGGYATGQTSRLGVVWWTDRNGNRHVRISADRSQASNFSVPEIFSAAQHPFHIIFPEDHMNCCSICDSVIWMGQGHWNGSLFDCDICIQQAVYFRETGFLPPGRRKKKK